MRSPCSLSYLSKWHHCIPRNSSPNLGLIPVSTWPPSPNPIRQQMLEILNKFFWNKSWISPLLLLWFSPKPPSIIIPLDSHKSLLTLLLLLLYTPFSSQKIESPLRNKNQSISLPCLIQLYSWPVLPPMSHPFVSPQPNCLCLIPTKLSFSSAPWTCAPNSFAFIAFGWLSSLPMYSSWAFS